MHIIHHQSLLNYLVQSPPIYQPRNDLFIRFDPGMGKARNWICSRAVQQSSHSPNADPKDTTNSICANPPTLTRPLLALFLGHTWCRSLKLAYPYCQFKIPEGIYYERLWRLIFLFPGKGSSVVWQIGAKVSEESTASIWKAEHWRWRRKVPSTYWYLGLYIKLYAVTFRRLDHRWDKHEASN